LLEIVREANEILSKGIEVKVYFLSREEAMKIPGIVKLAERMPPNIETWRIVEIPGIDIQADGGPHIKNTAEAGKIEVIKIENRGKDKKRIYYKLN
ncbi:alanyl-tRNA editing protein AlaX, partial [Acidianus sp. DSM 29099]|nr:alanyl-tRNA editing protein AlaX [Acidianus sp. RZ1]